MPTVDPYAPAPKLPDVVRPKTSAERANHEAGQLLKKFNAVKPPCDGFVPHVGMPDGSDIPPPHGMYTYALVGPEDWPTGSENAFKQAAKDWKAFQKRHENATESAKATVEEVFSTAWTEGEGSDAAYQHYAEEYSAHSDVIGVAEAGAAAFGRLGTDIQRTKRLIREAHDSAHREIEAYLNSPGGKPTATIAAIIAPYRTLIKGYSTELQTRDVDETTMLTNKLGKPETPPKDATKSFDNAMPSDGTQTGNPTEDPASAGGPKVTDPHGLKTDLPTAGDSPQGSGLPNPTSSLHNDLPTPVTGPSNGVGSTPPKMPSMPSMPSPPSMGSGGGGSSPMSSLSSGMGPLQQMFGKGLTGPLNNVNPAALQGPSNGAMSPASLGSQFGKGLSMGSGAAGAMPAMSSGAGVPQAPTTPLAAPLSQVSAPVSAAPAGGLTAPASNAAAAGAPATSGGGMPAGATPPMTSYGSVLPPSAMAPTAGAGGGGTPAIGGAPPPPPVTGNAGAAPTTGFMPVREQAAAQPVSRSVSMTDLELARAAVADLAAASSVVYPGLEWAVCVSRGSSGLPELWVTSNEGAGYIPAGVYLRRSMPLAARFDEDFDARWFGWFNPAETALRAVRARGDSVSAIATTWAQESRFLNEASPDVAIAVAPSSAPGDAEAAQLLNSRSHRLEIVAPAIYQSLEKANPDVAEAYARQLTQEAAFGPGPELSSLAQSVARTLVSSRWPSAEEWAALRSEYEMERLMAGSQRPGLTGMEEPAQLMAYVKDFVHCRRLETLLCWEANSPADVVYAAAMAGVSLNPLVTV